MEIDITEEIDEERYGKKLDCIDVILDYMDHCKEHGFNPEKELRALYSQVAKDIKHRW